MMVLISYGWAGVDMGIDWVVFIGRTTIMVRFITMVMTTVMVMAITMVIVTVRARVKVRITIRIQPSDFRSRCNSASRTELLNLTSN